MGQRLASDPSLQGTLPYGALENPLHVCSVYWKMTIIFKIVKTMNAIWDDRHVIGCPTAEAPAQMLGKPILVSAAALKYHRDTELRSNLQTVNCRHS